MLVFPHWRSELPGDGCRVQRWMPAERFAPYLARSVMPAPLPPTQVRIVIVNKQILGITTTVDVRNYLEQFMKLDGDFLVIFFANHVART